MPGPIHSEINEEVQFPPSEVWPILSKTDWINRAIGLPPVDYSMEPKPEGGSVVTGRARIFGIPMRWQENPFEWKEGEFYEVHRIFESGLLEEGRMGVTFERSGTNSTSIRVYSDLTPRNLLGSLAVRHVLAPGTNRAMRRAIVHAAEYLRGRKSVALPNLPRTAVNEVSFRERFEKLGAAYSRDDLVNKLKDELRNSPDVELSHIRPFSIAKKWGIDRWEVLRLFLHATRCGLLDFSWEILCPNCRSTREPRASSVAQLRQTSHCDVCQIRFDAEFDKSVELKFSVHSNIRPCDLQTFCLAGPGGKPHITSQLLVDAGKSRDWMCPPSTHSRRLRSPQVEESIILGPEVFPPTGFMAVVQCHPSQFEIRTQPASSGECTFQFVNPNPFTVQICIEQVEQNDEILTAAQVTNWQEFRDLFDTEVISPSERITVGSQVILFTDLRGSTAMYNGIGDAPAYALVRDHFAVLDAAIRENHGAIVKTIGDAVMAVFSKVEDALHAVKQMHDRLPDAVSSPSLTSRLMLKSSLHVGPCLAVNANDKLDYFGTTINLAARLVGSSKGDDLIISNELYERSETADFLRTIGESPEPSEVEFRGFDTTHRVWRIPMTCNPL